MSVLIVGSDSLIGSALRESCQHRKLPFYETSRRPRRNGIRLDLSEQPSHWQVPCGIRIGILCGAVTKISDCERDPIRTRRVNVEAPVLLASMLQEKGAAVLFLSTSLVFGGHTMAAKWDDPLKPETAYGHQKAEAEALISEIGPRVAILRITKVVHPLLPLFMEWATRLRSRLVIRPFSDRVFSPVPISLVVKAILSIVTAFTPGIFQLSGDKDISYSAAASLLAKFLDVPETLVQPRLSQTCHTVTAMRHTTLTPNLPPGVAAAASFPSVEETLADVYQHYKAPDMSKMTICLHT